MKKLGILLISMMLLLCGCSTSNTTTEEEELPNMKESNIYWINEYEHQDIDYNENYSEAKIVSEIVKAADNIRYLKTMHTEIVSETGFVDEYGNTEWSNDTSVFDIDAYNYQEVSTSYNGYTNVTSTRYIKEDLNENVNYEGNTGLYTCGGADVEPNQALISSANPIDGWVYTIDGESMDDYDVEWYKEGNNIYVDIVLTNPEALTEYYFNDYDYTRKSPTDHMILEYAGEPIYNEDLKNVAFEYVSQEFHVVINESGYISKYSHRYEMIDYAYLTEEITNHAIYVMDATFSMYNEELVLDYSFLQNNKKGVCSSYGYNNRERHGYEDETWDID